MHEHSATPTTTSSIEPDGRTGEARPELLPATTSPGANIVYDQTDDDPYELSREEIEFRELAQPITFDEFQGTGYVRLPDEPGPARGQVQLPIEAMDPVSLTWRKGKRWQYTGPVYRGAHVGERTTEVEIVGYSFGDKGVRATIFLVGSLVAP
jgi:hypothetical protein